MPSFLRLLPLLALPALAQTGPTPPAPGPREPAGYVLLSATGMEKILAAVRAADDERVAATLASDRARLAAVLSDELNYAHSSGRTDTKASYLETFTGGRAGYDSFRYVKREFVPISETIVLMRGRALLDAHLGDRKSSLDLNFLAVWRHEGDRWRFLAWQSSPAPRTSE